jgi:fibronectin type 3 domain-containing protein
VNEFVESNNTAYKTSYKLTVASPPPPPTGVSASDGSYTDRVRVVWNAASGATSYRVYRATSSGGAKTYLGAPTGTAFNDTSAVPGITYYYWVRSCNSAGCSGYSAYDTGYRAVSKPAKPLGVKASDGAYAGKVRVTWKAVPGATKYRVYRAWSATGSKKLLGQPTGTVFDDTTAKASHVYHYWVKACNSAGCSGFSAKNTGYRGKPPKLAGVKASDGAYTDKVRVTWKAIPGVTKYRVYRAWSATGSKKLLGQPTGRAFNDTTAKPGHVYHYWVKACNAFGCSGFGIKDTGYRAVSGAPAGDDATGSDTTGGDATGDGDANTGIDGLVDGQVDPALGDLPTGNFGVAPSDDQ